jgi:hypothetical protein
MKTVKHKQEGTQHTKARLGEFLKKKIGKHSDAWPEFIRVGRQLIGEEDTFL